MNRTPIVVALAASACVCVFQVQSADLTTSPATPFALTAARPIATEPGAARPLSEGAKKAPRGESAAPFSLAPAPTAADPVAATGEAPIDLSALHYFASRNDLKRVTAEIRLIRRKHPDWQPPEDLFNDSMATKDETGLWQKFAKGDFAGIHADIDAMKADNPDWRPSSDFSNKLALAEAFGALKQASNENRWQDVIDVASNNKMLLTCDYVDALWRVSEALIHSDDETRAIEVYRYVLTNCQKPEERLATAQKASALIKSPDAVNDLLSLGRRSPDGRDEFEQVRLDQLRKTIGDAAADPHAPAPSAPMLEAFMKRARGAGMQKDQLLLGWYAYSRKDYPQAAEWFGKSNQPEPSSEAAKGLVMTLRASDKLDDALKLAKQFAPLGAPNKKLLAELEVASLGKGKATALSSEDLAQLSSAIDEAKDAAGAQNLGWSLYNGGSIAPARAWFEKSLAWAPSEPAALGLVVAVQRLGDIQGLDKALATYRTVYPAVADFEKSIHKYAYVVRPSKRRARAGRGGGGGGGGWDANANAIAQTLESEKFDETIAMLNARRESHRADPAGLDVVRGWALYHKHDYDAASAAFRQAAAKGLHREASQGLEQIEKDPWSKVGHWKAVDPTTAYK